MLKRRIRLALLIIGVLLAISFFAWQYVFQIYEVKAELSDDTILFSSSGDVKLSVYPLNSLGKKIPFRSVDAAIEFSSGEDLVETIFLNNSETKAIFKPIGKCGTINIIVRCKYSFSPMRLNFSVNE